MLIMPRTSGRYGRPSTPPVGLAYLATYLKMRDHEVKLIDMRVENEDFDYLSSIKSFKPGFVGVSFVSNGYKYSYDLVNEIKDKTGATIVIGGAHSSTVRGKALEECKADYVVYGEGEITLSELVEGKRPSDIKGLIWREGKKININPPREPLLDLDSLPFPDYGMFKLEKYSQKRIPLNTARGCPHLCTYCAVDLVIGRRFRARSARNVVDEIESWYKKGFTNFGFNDSTFTENMKRAEEIAEELIRRGIDIKWDLRTGIRVDRVNKKLLSKLKQAGCTFVAFGIESIDPEVIGLMQKGTTFEMVERAVKDAKDCGLGVGGFFMIGTPGDTYEKFERSYRYADQDIFDEVRFYNTEPYPGTVLFDWIKEKGKFLVDPEIYLNSKTRWDEDPIFETGDFNSDERRKAFNQGEYLVVKKLLIKILGKRIGNFASIPCRIKWFRKITMIAGFRLAPLIFGFISSKKAGKPI
ncbi:MAG: radical SAM protein [Candidatus Omnitrophota bacterium]